jgi:CDP-Glycerol:Poly(glycerophosphate) glycerophosphotransferase
MILMQVAAIISHDTESAIKNKIYSIENIHVYFWLGELFSKEEILFTAKQYEFILIDDTIFNVINIKSNKLIPISYYLGHQGNYDFKVNSFINKQDNYQKKELKKSVLFVASNDTHVKFFEEVSKLTDNSYFMAIDRGENADTALEDLGNKYHLFPVRYKGLNKLKKYSLKYMVLGFYKMLIYYIPYVFLLMRIFNTIKKENISVIILGNDWAREEKIICKWAKKNRIKTVCIQEGPLDFSTENRMRNAEYAFLQGAYFTNYLKRGKVIFTGNPRFPKYMPSSNKNKLENKIMVNCNFTYGVHEDKRDSWIHDIVDSCNALNIDYFISKHPRDRGDYSKYNVLESNAFHLNEQLQNSDIVISRFSTVIYEALLRGKTVIYYNPHNEDGKPFTDDGTGAIRIAKDRAELQKIIKEVYEEDYDNSTAIDEFLLLHCGKQDGKVNERVLTSLNYLMKDVI